MFHILDTNLWHQDKHVVSIIEKDSASFEKNRVHFIVKIRYNHKSITSVMNTNRIAGPPERMGTWGLVPTPPLGLNPIPIRRNDYAHHYIGLSPLDF